MTNTTTTPETDGLTRNAAGCLVSEIPYGQRLTMDETILVAVSGPVWHVLIATNSGLRRVVAVRLTRQSACAFLDGYCCAFAA